MLDKYYVSTRYCPMNTNATLLASLINISYGVKNGFRPRRGDVYVAKGKSHPSLLDNYAIVSITAL